MAFLGWQRVGLCIWSGLSCVGAFGRKGYGLSDDEGERGQKEGKEGIKKILSNGHLVQAHTFHSVCCTISSCQRRRLRYPDQTPMRDCRMTAWKSALVQSATLPSSNPPSHAPQPQSATITFHPVRYLLNPPHIPSRLKSGAQRSPCPPPPPQSQCCSHTCPHRASPCPPHPSASS